MRVRVYQPIDQPARIVTPTAELRAEGESDVDFLARIAAHTEAADPTLAGLPFVDVDHAELPTERMREVEGKAIHVRNAWRLQGETVVVAEDVVSVIVAEVAEAAEK